jgi:hypothetical protein
VFPTNASIQNTTLKKSKNLKIDLKATLGVFCVNMAEYTEAEKEVMVGQLKDMLVDSSSHLKQWIEQRLVSMDTSLSNKNFWPLEYIIADIFILCLVGMIHIYMHLYIFSIWVLSR